MTTLSWVNGLSDRHETLLPVPRNLATLDGRKNIAKRDGADIPTLNVNPSVLSATPTLAVVLVLPRVGCDVSSTCFVIKKKKERKRDKKGALIDISMLRYRICVKKFVFLASVKPEGFPFLLGQASPSLSPPPTFNCVILVFSCLLHLT